MKSFLPLVVFGVLVFGVLGSVSADGKTGAAFGVDLNIIELADRLGFYSCLLALKETGLTEIVRTTSPITLFIPTNEAFLSLSQSTRDAWAADPMYYQKLLSYHVVKGAVRAEDLQNDFSYYTLAGDNTTARINIYKQTPTVVTYMGSQVVQTNFVATNGIIHVIDKVVEDIQNKTMLQLVEESSDLSMLLNATKNLPNIINVLQGNTPYTLFAPSNAAIKKLPTGVWERLLNNATGLTEVLTYHVASNGTYYSLGLTDGWTLPTLNKAGSPLIVHVNKKDGTITINTSLVTEANNAAINGVIHVIDQVLLPF